MCLPINTTRHLFFRGPHLSYSSFVATPYYKPNKNESKYKPDYYLHETDQWLVFPHELEGLSLEEIQKNKPELQDLMDKIKEYL